ncbi:MAG: hypothetical protein AMXMBFR84_08750 [Candidatus Hydrogenedentota bacterium]
MPSEEPKPNVAGTSPPLPWAKALSLAYQVGMTVVAGSVGGVLLGIFLERRFGGGGFYLMGCVFLGVAGGAFGAYRILSREITWKP